VAIHAGANALSVDARQGAHVGNFLLVVIYNVDIRYRKSIMRTLVDIPDRQIKRLTAICEAEKVSRAEIIRQAISSFLEQKKTGTVEAFGLWKGRKVDGLAYQEQVRSEW